MKTSRRQRGRNLARAFGLAGLAGALTGNVRPGLAAGWPRHVIDGSSQGADGVRLSDADGDGLEDVTTGWEEGGVVRVYFHPGPTLSRAPWPAVTVGDAESVEDAVFADLDGDGSPEVVSCLEGKARRVQVHWPPRLAAGLAPAERRRRWLDPGAWHTTPLPATFGRRWMFAVPSQLDGRHGVDLIVGAKGPDAVIAWLEAPADPRQTGAWRLHPIRPCGWIMTLRLADLDHDGNADLLFSDRKGPRKGVFWLENPGPQAVRAGAAWAEHPVLRTETEVMFVDLASKGAGWRMAAALKPRRLVLCAIDQARAAADDWPVRAEAALPANFGTAKAVRLAALRPGQPPGLLFTCEGATAELSGVGWFPAKGEGFGRVVDVGGPAGLKFDRIELRDLDADGDLDVMTCEERDNLGVIWYENPAH